VTLLVTVLVALSAVGVALGVWQGTRSEAPGGSGGSASAAASDGTVVAVVDGDTLDVAGVGRVRLIGIDTPERGECGYAVATQALSAQALGRQVTLLAGAQDDTDRYGRLLRYVIVDGVDVGLAQLEQGLAVARYDSRDGYGAHDRQSEYVAADAAAPALAGCADGPPG
jgi:endonuclease YncB( thermonuclease family)